MTTKTTRTARQPRNLNPKLDRPIAYTLSDPDAPIPYRIRLATASPELRAFVVPRLSIPCSSTPPAPASGELPVSGVAELPSAPRLVA